MAMDCDVDLPLVLYSYSLAFEQFNLGVVLFGLKLAICPFTRYDDTIVAIWSFLVVVDHPIRKVFFVTSTVQPSIHPQFDIAALFNEDIRDQMVTGLADATLYDVHLEPEILDPGVTLLRLPGDLIDDRPVNADNVIQVLQEKVFSTLIV